jgi:hypothetical protein
MIFGPFLRLGCCIMQEYYILAVKVPDRKNHLKIIKRGFQEIHSRPPQFVGTKLEIDKKLFFNSYFHQKTKIDVSSSSFSIKSKYQLWICMYTYLYVCIHICMYVYIYVCIYILMYLCMYVCIYTYVCVCVCVCVCI